MEEYIKIQSIFKRDMSLPGKPMIMNDFSTPELEYLADNEWEFTEKIDGTNIRVDYRQSPSDGVNIRFGGRTDNAQISTKLLDSLQSTFAKEFFLNAALPDLTLYGEGYGAGIQKGGGNYQLEQSFVLFDVLIDGWWLSRDNVNDIARKLKIKSVPTIGHGTLYDAIDIVKNELKSQWGDFEAEGIVARPVVPLFNRKGERILVKIKGRDF